MSTEPGKGKAEAGQTVETMLASIYEEYYERIARYAYTRIGNKADAEDLAGEVFLKALESRNSYKERGIPIQAWLFKIAHNLVVDYLRKMTSRQTVLIDTVQIDGGANPVTVAENNIELENVAKAMEQLTIEQREVLSLRFLAGLTSKEAGSILNKSDGAIREMQRAAIEKLRRILTSEYQIHGIG